MMKRENKFSNSTVFIVAVVSTLLVVKLITFAAIFPGRSSLNQDKKTTAVKTVDKHLREIKKRDDQIQNDVKSNSFDDKGKSLSYTPPHSNSIYGFSLPTINTEDNFASLSHLTGHLSIVINVACAWGKTALTYNDISAVLRANDGLDDTGDDALATLDLKSDKITILAFPTNDFHQEPGTDEEIGETVLKLLGPELYHNPNFLLFKKSSLATNPIYQLLRKQMPKNMVKHNFYKYVVDRDGVPIKFYTKKDSLFEIIAELKDDSS